MAKYAKPVLPIDVNNEAAIDGDWYYMGDDFVMPDGTHNNGDHEILTGLGYYKWVHPVVDPRFEEAIATYIWTGTGTTQEVTKKVADNNENQMRDFLYTRIYEICNFYLNQIANPFGSKAPIKYSKVETAGWNQIREIYKAWYARGGGFETLLAEEAAHFEGETGSLTADQYWQLRVKNKAAMGMQFNNLVKSIRTDLLGLVDAATYPDGLKTFDYISMWNEKTDFNDSSQRPPGVSATDWGKYLNQITWWTE